MAQRISVRVPATSANLGCLFDCAALALSLYLDIHVSRRDDEGVTIRYRGVTPERVPADSSNLIAHTIFETLKSWKKPRGFDLDIENQIPVGVGLGSSAAGIVGALTACRWLADTTLFDEDLISLAARIEGHPDNVAAAWLGGFAVAVTEGERVLATSCPFPPILQLVAVVPEYDLPTKKARAALPSQYSREDAVHNLQRAAVIAAELFSGKADLRPALFDDRWHQPYRVSLVPGLAEVLRFTHHELVGLWLSGAGPSVLALVRGDAATIGGAICRILADNGVEAHPHILAADNRGAKGWSAPA